MVAYTGGWPKSVTAPFVPSTAPIVQSPFVHFDRFASQSERTRMLPLLQDHHFYSLLRTDTACKRTSHRRTHISRQQRRRRHSATSPFPPSSSLQYRRHRDERRTLHVGRRVWGRQLSTQAWRTVDKKKRPRTPPLPVYSSPLRPGQGNLMTSKMVTSSSLRHSTSGSSGQANRTGHQRRRRASPRSMVRPRQMSHRPLALRPSDLRSVPSSR